MKPRDTDPPTPARGTGVRASSAQPVGVSPGYYRSRGASVSQTFLQHTLQLVCAPLALYDYVTQLWRWHEWHPSSRHARAAVDRLQAGDEFEEEIELQPLAPWPPTLRRQTHYRVLEAQPGVQWEAEGRM